MTTAVRKKAVLVTGGADRLGRAMALGLADKGYAVALHYRSSKARAQRTARLIRARGAECRLFRADLLDRDQTGSLISDVDAQFPGLEILVNNASLFEKDRDKGVDETRLKQHLGIHLTAPYVLSLEFARLCRKGLIVNMLDTRIFSDKEETAYRSYLLSKKALADWTRIAALKLAPGVRVNGIAPGLILPPAGKTAVYLDKLAGNVPLKRRGRPQHIVRALEYLIDNDYVTGQILAVDGGQHLC